jgi:hypothetical protein
MGKTNTQAKAQARVSIEGEDIAASHDLKALSASYSSQAKETKT